MTESDSDISRFVADLSTNDDLKAEVKAKGASMAAASLRFAAPHESQLAHPRRSPGPYVRLPLGLKRKYRSGT